MATDKKPDTIICKICGEGEAIIVDQLDGKTWGVHCSKCNSSTTRDSEQECIDAWNDGDIEYYD